MLACLLLQAHIIIPHFHHDGIVCITHENNTDCQKCNSSEEHNHAKDDCSDILEECDIKQIVIRQNNLDEGLDIHSIDYFSLYYLIYPLGNLYLESPDLITKQNQIPYTKTYTSPFTGYIKSLRAPPLSSYLS